MAGDNNGEIEDILSRAKIGQDTVVSTRHTDTQRAENLQAGHKRQRPVEDVDDAPNSEAAKKARGDNGQRMMAPTRRLMRHPKSILRTSTTFRSGRRDDSLEEFRSSDFLPGYIIWAPIHETMMNPNPDMNDPKIVASIAQSKIATISSKRRPAIVLAAYKQNMLVMPIGTRGGRDLSDIPVDLLREYVAMRESGTSYHVDTGYYEYCLRAYMARGEKLSKFSAVRLSHVTKVEYAEDIKIVGALDNESTHWLIGIWLELREDAEYRGWRKDLELVDQGQDRWEVDLRKYTQWNNRSR